MSFYKQEHPNVDIDIQIGLSESSSVTREDALRTLNTEILSGNGPDIILLDGINIKNYINKKVLVDLSEVVKTVDSREGLFRNITDVYKENDKIYAIPSRFSLIAAIGDEEVTKAAEEDVSRYLATLKEREKEEYLFGGYFPYMGNILYRIMVTPRVFSAKLVSEDIKEYYKQLKVMFELNGKKEISDKKVGEKQEGVWSIMSNKDNDFSPKNNGEIETLYWGLGKTAVNYISSVEDFQLLAALKDKGLAYNLIGLQSKSFFAPNTILGVNQKGKNTELAKEFIQYALTANGQQRFGASYLSINKTEIQQELANAYKNTYIMVTDDNEELELNVSELSTEMQIEAMRVMGIPDVETNIDTTISDIVFEYADSYLQDSMSLSEAVETVMQKVNLYLSE